MEKLTGAKEHFFSNKKNIMNLYSTIAAQLEAEGVENNEYLTIVSAYYAVISYIYLRSMPIITAISKFIEKNDAKPFDDFEFDLTVCIVVESLINDAERKQYITVEGNEIYIIKLTNKGKEICLEKETDVTGLLNFGDSV